MQKRWGHYDEFFTLAILVNQSTSDLWSRRSHHRKSTRKVTWNSFFVKMCTCLFACCQTKRPPKCPPTYKSMAEIICDITCLRTPPKQMYVIYHYNKFFSPGISDNQIRWRKAFESLHILKTFLLRNFILQIQHLFNNTVLLNKWYDRQ